jgi:hypothetical protein
VTELGHFERGVEWPYYVLSGREWLHAWDSGLLQAGFRWNSRIDLEKRECSE